MSDQLMPYTIYALIDNQGIVRYVGATVLDVRVRVQCHWGMRGKREAPVSQWLATFTRCPRYRVLEDNVSQDNFIVRETFWINHFGLETLLNVGLGGRGGSRWNDQQLTRLREVTRSPVVREKNRQAQLGRKHSDETKRKIGDAHRGRPKSQSQREANRRAIDNEDRSDKTCECGIVCRGPRGLAIHRSKTHREDVMK